LQRSFAWAFHALGQQKGIKLVCKLCQSLGVLLFLTGLAELIHPFAIFRRRGDISRIAAGFASVIVG
jgi:hypothetical protein